MRAHKTTRLGSYKGGDINTTPKVNNDNGLRLKRKTELDGTQLRKSRFPEFSYGHKIVSPTRAPSG